MSILNPTTDPAVNAANQVRSIVRQQFVQLLGAGTRGFNVIWKNPSIDPISVISALGTDAAIVFQLAALNISTVQTAATIAGTTAPAIPEIPSQYTVTFNSDGSANVVLNGSGSGSGSDSGSNSGS